MLRGKIERANNTRTRDRSDDVQPNSNKILQQLHYADTAIISLHFAPRNGRIDARETPRNFKRALIIAVSISRNGDQLNTDCILSANCANTGGKREGEKDRGAADSALTSLEYNGVRITIYFSAGDPPETMRAARECAVAQVATSSFAQAQKARGYGKLEKHVL